MKEWEQLCKEAQENTRRAIDLLWRSRSMPIPAICTVGGYECPDDDNEDFWCPVCHSWLGDYRHYERKCQNCGQTIADFDAEYTRAEILKTQWRES